MVNIRRKNRHQSAGLELKFGESTVKDTDDIVNGWCGYFVNLYNQSESPHFDGTFKQAVDEKST